MYINAFKKCEVVIQVWSKMPGKAKIVAGKAGPNTVMHIAPSTANFAKLLTDPFKDKHHCCMPTIPALPSGKRTAWIKGAFTCSSTGSGMSFVTMNPWRMCTSNAATFSDKCAFGVYASSSSFTGSTIETSTLSGVPETGVNGYNSNAIDDFGGLTVPSGELFRVCAAGLRIRYKGTERQRGGDIVGYSLPMQESSNGKTRSNLLAYQKVHSLPITREWCMVKWTPQHPKETDYMDYEDLSDTSSAGEYPWTSNTPLAFVCLSPTDSGTVVPLVMEFEAYVHYERIGRNVPDTTMSIADPVGFQAVTSTVQDNKQAIKGTESEGYTLEKVANFISHHTSGIRTIWSSLPPEARRQLLNVAGAGGAQYLLKHRQSNAPEYALRDEMQGTTDSHDAILEEGEVVPGLVQSDGGFEIKRKSKGTFLASEASRLRTELKRDIHLLEKPDRLNDELNRINHLTQNIKTAKFAANVQRYGVPGVKWASGGYAGAAHEIEKDVRRAEHELGKARTRAAMNDPSFMRR